MAAGREHLGDARGGKPRGGHTKRRTQTGAAGADDDDVIGVID